jgi:hypothetical protein
MDQKFGNFGDTADVFFTVVVAKAQIIVDPGPDIVAVENLGKIAFIMQDNL